MKKIVTIIIAVLVVIGLGVGAFFCGDVVYAKEMGKTSKPKEEVQKTKSNVKTQGVSNAITSNNDSTNTNNVTSSKVNKDENKEQSVSSVAENNNQNMPISESKPEIVKILNYGPNVMFSKSSVIVENTTDRNIPNSVLVEAMKKWILQYQYQYNGFADCNGTMWSKHWLDNIPDSDLIKYFIEANGEGSLKGNIYAVQLYNAARKSLQFAEEHPVPFSLNVAKKYITEMMIKSQGIAPDKIVFHGNSKEGGDYYVYVKGHKQPYWYVESPIGYGTGV